MPIKPLSGCVKLKETPPRYPAVSYSNVSSNYNNSNTQMNQNFTQRWARAIRIRRLGVARRAGFVPGQRVEFILNTSRYKGTIMRYFTAHAYSDEANLFSILYEDTDGINRLESRSNASCTLVN